MGDVDDYLQEGFDPRNVTVPRLRSILVTHNVDYPSTAKKGQLVDLVNEHVLSQAPKLRAQRLKAKRSSLGFVNAGGADDSNTWEGHEPRSRQSSSRRSVSPRKSSTRIKAEPEESENSVLRSPRKRSSRSASRQLSHVEGDDDEGPTSNVPRSVRRASRRTATPQVKIEPEDEDEEQDIAPSHASFSRHEVENSEDEDELEKSVFTDDNPFQSGGSSPPSAVTPSHRRRTLGGDVPQSTRSASRQVDGSSIRSKKSRTSRTPDASLRKHRPKTPDFSLEPGEEFTVDEQLELDEAQNAGELTVAPRKSRKLVRQSSALTPLFVLLMALLGAYGAWYRQEKLAVGYCGLGRPAKQLLPPEIAVPDALLPFIEPQCEPCPQNAYCYEGFAARCVSGFILKPHPLSIGGLVPLPPTCEPDSEQERRVQAVADKAVEELRERRAKYECGDLADEADSQENSPAIAEEDLKEAVSKKRNKRLSNEEFDALWEKAIGKVTTREEVEVQVETTT